MHCRSSRPKERANDTEESNIESTKDIDISTKTKDIESVSNDTFQGNKQFEMDEIEQKDYSERQTVAPLSEPSPEQKPEQSSEQATDPQPSNNEQSDAEIPETLTATRSKRNVKRVSYKDDSSSEGEGDEVDDPMFAGLSEEQKVCAFIFLYINSLTKVDTSRTNIFFLNTGNNERENGSN